jgi:hypothetical protein
VSRSLNCQARRGCGGIGPDCAGAATRIPERGVALRFGRAKRFVAEALLVWLLIIVILLVAFGPILWLRPSPRDRRLTMLRAQGRKEGLLVEMRRYPKLDLAPEERVTAGGKPIPSMLESAVYLKPLDPKLRHLPGWRILRATEGLPALPGWVFELGRRPDSEHMRGVLAALEPLVARLPGDVVAVECDPLNLGVYWLERPGNGPAEVTALAGWLAEAAERLDALELEAALRAAGPPLDS